MRALRFSLTRMFNPRLGLHVGVALAALVSLILAFTPANWLGEMLSVSGDGATSFLVRRYGASATAALAVGCLQVARGAHGEHAALQSFATWFAGQGLVAIHGVATGTVGGFAWLAVFADPALAAWFLLLALRPASRTPPVRGA